MGPLLYARCLGEPLLLDRHRVPVKLRVRKHLALLLFLVVEPRHRASRERLKRMFWPEGKSSQSLSQAISELRAALGADVFDISEHYVGLAKGIVIERDLDLLSTGDADLLLRELSNSFWGHVLFDGMEFEDAEEWNTWLGVERGRWTERIARTAKHSLDVPGAMQSLTLGERAQLVRWQRALTGGEASCEVAPPTRPLRWTDVDWRVHRARQLLVQLDQPAIVAVGVLTADSACVVKAALHSIAPNLTARVIDSRKHPFTVSALLRIISALPGVLGASPEALSLLSAEPAAVDDAHAEFAERIESAAVEALEAICYEAPLALIVVGQVSSATTKIWQRLQNKSPESKAWLVLDGEAMPSSAASCPTGAQRVVVHRLRRSDKKAAACLLSAGGFEAHRIAANHPIVAECVLTLTTSGQHLAVHEIISEIGRATGLPSSLAIELLEDGTRPVEGRKRIRRKSGNDIAALLHPHSCALVLLNSSQRDALEAAVESGLASGHSARAALLWSRSIDAKFSAAVAAESIVTRSNEAIRAHNALEDVEALAFSLLITDSFIADAALGALSAAMLLGAHRKPSAALNAARLILAQQTREEESEMAALSGLASMRQSQPDLDLSVRFALSYGASLRDTRHGNYLAADRRLVRLAALALRHGHKEAFERAIGQRLLTSARLGNSQEVLSSARACGLALVQRKARAGQPWPELLVRAARHLNDKAMIGRAIDLAEATSATQASPRALALSSRFFAECGIQRRSLVLGDQAAAGLRGAPLRGQEAEWISVLAPRLSASEMRAEIEALRTVLVRVDVRDKQVIRRNALSHGLNERELTAIGLTSAQIPCSAVL